MDFCISITCLEPVHMMLIISIGILDRKFYPIYYAVFNAFRFEEWGNRCTIKLWF